jgi:hypothetical protein
MQVCRFACRWRSYEEERVQAVALAHSIAGTLLAAREAVMAPSGRIFAPRTSPSGKRLEAFKREAKALAAVLERFRSGE